MNNNNLLYGIIGLVVLVLVAATGVYVYQQMADEAPDSSQDTSSESTGPGQNSDENDEEEVDPNRHTSEKGVTLIVTEPARGGEVSSPLEVTGEVPGSWSHEAQFTVRLLDSNSRIIAEEAATLDGDWMTEDMVKFSATLEFEAPEDGAGLLVLEKANPSGLEENADSLTIPIAF